MSFSFDCRTLRSGKTSSQRVHSKKSVNTENIADASETCGAEEINGSISRILHELIEEKVRANLEPLRVQISTLTKLLNQLIQDYSPQREVGVPVPIAHWRDPCLLERPEPLEPRPTRHSEVWDSRPTVFFA